VTGGPGRQAIPSLATSYLSSATFTQAMTAPAGPGKT